MHALAPMLFTPLRNFAVKLKMVTYLFAYLCVLLIKTMLENTENMDIEYDTGRIKTLKQLCMILGGPWVTMNILAQLFPR